MDTVVIMGGGQFEFVAHNDTGARSFNPFSIGAQTGEVVIAVSHSLGVDDIPAELTPSGWTLATSTSVVEVTAFGNFRVASRMHWKKMDSGDNTNIAFFGTGATAYVNQIFRFDTSLSLFDQFDINQEGTSGNPTPQVKNASGQNFPLIVMAYCGSFEQDGAVGGFSQFSPAPQFTRAWQVNDFAVDRDGSGTAAGIVYNPGDNYQDVTVDKGSNGDRDWLASFILRGLG